MNYPLAIHGKCLPKLTTLMLSKGWRADEEGLFLDGKRIFTFAREDEAYLPLPPSATSSEMMLRWFWAPELKIRSAHADDLDALCSLKEKRIRENFSFFSEKEMKMALNKSASKEYMQEEIDKHDFRVGLDHGVIKAVAGLKKIDEENAFIYSIYSEGKKGGAAIISFLIHKACKDGYQKMTANVYQENSCGSRSLEQFGFKKETEILQSTYVPGYPINRWVLQLD